MPGRDKTGPTGMGPMTGWGRGYCGGQSDAGFVNNFSQRDYRGRCQGRGRSGFRNRFCATGFLSGAQGTGWGPGGWRGAMREDLPSGEAPEREAQPGEEGLDVLKAQARHVEQLLGDIKSRIEKLESSSKAEQSGNGITG